MALPKDIRNDFPIFKHNPDLVYLDNAATTQKPQVMVDATVDFYTKYYATIHRGLYDAAEDATMRYEEARATIAAFIGADQHEIIFVKNATEGINLAAFSWALQNVKRGDTILLSHYEHHANLLPWQRVAQQNEATLQFIPMDNQGRLRLDQLDRLCTPKTKLVAISAVSNVTGAHTHMQPIIAAARAVGAKVLVDASQMVAHAPINVHALGVDYVVFSGHKLFGPTGIGVLYARNAIQEEMVPYQLGGGTIFDADWQYATYRTGPLLFEAGTPPVAQAIGLAAAVRYLQQYSFADIAAHEAALVAQAINGLQEIPRVRLFGPLEELKNHGHLVSFLIDGVHAHDVAAYLSQHTIAVRAGHHCAQPLVKNLGVDALVRASVALYNTEHDVHAMIEAIKKLRL